MIPPSITFSRGDNFILVAFFVIILWIGLKFVRTKGKILDFLVGGRTLTLPVFVLTLFSTWYGGILGMGEFGFTYGISSWITQGVPYYIFAFIFAVLLAKLARRAEVVTIPDQLNKVYGRNVSFLGAFFTGILSCPAPYVLMIAVLLQIITGWSLMFCLVLGTVSCLFYLWFGGFKADVATDVFFGIIMIVGFAIILPFLYMKFGGASFIKAHVPEQHLQWRGGNSTQFIVMWFFIGLWTFIEPTFYQRCYAAKSEKVAVWGILISVFFWFVFDLMTVTAALYAKAIFQNLDQPMLTYPFLAQLVLPSFWKGFFYAGMLATILSTLNSGLFVSATSLGRDLFWRLDGEHETKEFRWIRIGMVLSACLSIWMAYKIPSVVNLWYTIGTIIVPGLLIAMISTFVPAMQISSRWMLGVMSSGFLTSLICLWWGWHGELGSDHFPFGLEPMFPGLFVSIIVWGLAKLLRQKPEIFQHRLKL